MNKSNVFDHSLDHCIKVNLTWLSKLLDALPKATDPEVKEVMRFNRNAMQMSLIDFIDQAEEKGDDYPAAEYHSIMCRAYVSEQREKQEALDGNEILKKGDGKTFTKQELENSLDNLNGLIQFHGQSLVEISHPGCEGPHDLMIGDYCISLD